jgi:hypothetical protein
MWRAIFRHGLVRAIERGDTPREVQSRNKLSSQPQDRPLTHGAEPFLRSYQLCTYSTTSQHFMEPEGSLPCSQEPSTGPYPVTDESNLISIFFHLCRLSKESVQVRGFLRIFVTSLFFYGELLAPRPTQAGGPPLVGCPRLFIQYIRSYPSYLEGVSSIQNLRTRHVVVTRDPPSMAPPTLINWCVPT